MTLTFEDFRPGPFGSFGPRHVTREEMLAFAAEFDPQPMHLDEEAARHSMLEAWRARDRATARTGIVHLHRRQHQEIRRAIRPATLSSRRGSGPRIAVRRPGGLGLACRVDLHEASGRRWPA